MSRIAGSALTSIEREGIIADVARRWWRQTESATITEIGPDVQSECKVRGTEVTVADVFVIDSTSRKPIGRPTLTVAIDVATRCVLRICLSLEGVERSFL